MLTVDFERFQVEPGMRALDVGCGQGRHSLEFLRRGCPVVALDLLPDDLRHTRYLLSAVAGEEAARDSGTPHPARFVVLKGNALQLPFPSNSFDRVICSEVLEHVTNPVDATAELVRVLRPGGLLAVSVPTPTTEWPFWFASGDYFNSPGGHVRIFTPHRLKLMLRQQGLELVNINMEHSFHSIYWWVRSVFGLHDEQHPAIRHFKKVLTYAMFSPMLTRAERALNYVLPKSMVYYGRKVEPSPATPGTSLSTSGRSGPKRKTATGRKRTTAKASSARLQAVPAVPESPERATPRKPKTTARPRKTNASRAQPATNPAGRAPASPKPGTRKPKGEGGRGEKP